MRVQIKERLHKQINKNKNVKKNIKTTTTRKIKYKVVLFLN